MRLRAFTGQDRVTRRSIHAVEAVPFLVLLLWDLLRAFVSAETGPVRRDRLRGEQRPAEFRSRMGGATGAGIEPRSKRNLGFRRRSQP